MPLLGTGRIPWPCSKEQGSRQRRSGLPSIPRSTGTSGKYKQAHIRYSGQGIVFLLTRTITWIFGSSTSLVEPMSAVSLFLSLLTQYGPILYYKQGAANVRGDKDQEGNFMSEMSVSRLERRQPPEALCNVNVRIRYSVLYGNESLACRG